MQEVETPTPKPDEVRVRVHATGVTAGDCELRSLKFPLYLQLPMRIFAGIRRPTRIKIIGQEFAGEIEAVGRDVKSFRVGDQVFGATGFAKGTYAEYICLPEMPKEMGGLLIPKPTNMTYEEAGTVPTGGLEALHFLRQADVQSGQRVLINGAGGSIGTFAIQLAKHYGAEVSAVDSTAKLGMLRSIGADHVIDYTRQDFTKSGESYDVIFDVVGKSPYSASIRSLKPDGRYLLANPGLPQMVRGPWTSRTSDKRVIIGTAEQKAEDLVFLKEMIEAGKLKSVIDRRFPLEQAAEAHRYVETGQKAGNVVITVEHNDES